MTIRIILSWALTTMVVLGGCAKKSEPKDEPATPGVAAQASQSALLVTRWVLTELDGAPIAGDSAKEPIYIQFNADSSQVTGFGGCNRIMGSFQISADTLIFGHMASTKMACPSGEDVEMKLLSVLEAVWTYAIVGDELELKSGAATVARFRSSRQ